jgi:hypothetical protein
LGNDVFDDSSHNETVYADFIDYVLYYQRLFEYCGDIVDILNLPYCLFQDLILKQIQLKKKEQQELEKVKRRKPNTKYK